MKTRERSSNSLYRDLAVSLLAAAYEHLAFLDVEMEPALRLEVDHTAYVSADNRRVPKKGAVVEVPQGTLTLEAVGKFFDG
ncbi:MAG TPA: hypothetical protein VFY54_11200 [Rubrobacter sp.]|nr:hypothetical protein [Rubrobacter sp.]